MANTNILIPYLSLTDTHRLLKSYVDHAYAEEGRSIQRHIGLLTAARIENALLYLEAALAESGAVEALPESPGDTHV